jgi:hypothetical protein
MTFDFEKKGMRVLMALKRGGFAGLGKRGCARNRCVRERGQAVGDEGAEVAGGGG